MDKLEFYKQQYAFLMGEIDKAVCLLENRAVIKAYCTLVRAMSSAEQRWLDAFPEEAPEADTDPL